MPADPDSHARLLAENARLAALLDAHGIEWRIADRTTPRYTAEPAIGQVDFSADAKVALFRTLCSAVARMSIRSAGRGKAAASPATHPACANEWRAWRLREAAHQVLADCGHRLLCAA
jgi:hypothetical protein